MSVIPYSKSKVLSEDKAEAVNRMFDSIAPRYDLMNDIMTVGFHRRWKKLTAEEVCQNGATRALDLACGTGDITLALNRAGAKKITGIDFSINMISRAKTKAEVTGSSEKISFGMSDALYLPFPDNSFDSITTGFSLRNIDGIDKMFSEAYRVLSRDGRFASLELTKMDSLLLNYLFKLYFKKIIPFVGGILTGDREAYDYLPESIANVPIAENVAVMLENAGFRSVKVRRLGMGSVALVSGIKV